MPTPSLEGIVVDVKIFTKKGYDKDPRAVQAYEARKRDFGPRAS